MHTNDSLKKYGLQRLSPLKLFITKSMYLSLYKKDVIMWKKYKVTNTVRKTTWKSKQISSTIDLFMLFFIKYGVIY